MKMRYIGTTAVLFAGAMSVTFASAHVTAQPNEAAADSYFVTAFSVPHGCDGSATIAVRMKIPDGVTSVKPQMKAGWEVSIKTRNLDKPAAAGHGATASETVDEVAWRGGPLPDTLFDTFGLLMKLPDAPGQTLYFPVIQECQQGVHRWIEIPTGQQTWGDLREPAPFLRLKPKTP
jgi:periplasmic copper chaperone A